MDLQYSGSRSLYSGLNNKAMIDAAYTGSNEHLTVK